MMTTLTDAYNTLAKLTESLNKDTSNEINSYVLCCVADSIQCFDENLWKKETEKISKTLHTDQMINFENLGWYFMSKYPDLYKLSSEIRKDKNLAKLSSNALRAKTHIMANELHIPSTIVLSKDPEFEKKQQERKTNFLKFLDTGKPSSMEFSEMIKITGSLDYKCFHLHDAHKHNEFVNTGYQMMSDFIEGKLPINKEDVGEAYLFFKQIVYDVTKRRYDIPFKYTDVLDDCIIPQLENVRSGLPLEKQTKFAKYEGHLNSAKNLMNQEFVDFMNILKQANNDGNATSR